MDTSNGGVLIIVLALLGWAQTCALNDIKREVHSVEDGVSHHLGAITKQLQQVNENLSARCTP